MQSRRLIWTTVVMATALIAQAACAGGGVTDAETEIEVGKLDGTYTGSWSSVDQGATDTGTLTFTLAGGVISGAANPGTISTGKVSSTGHLTGSGIFNGHLHCEGGTLTIDFTGKVTLTSSGGAVAEGDFTDPSGTLPNCVGSSGPWTATRTP